MKKYLLFLFIVILSSCQGDFPQHKAPQPQGKPRDQLRVTYHTITLDQAGEYISNFLKQNSLRTISTQHIIGGYLPINAAYAQQFLQNFTDNTVPILMLYPCYDKGFFSDKVFMCTKLNSNGDPADPCKIANDDQFRKSKYGFIYDQPSYEKDDVKAWLSNMATDYSTTIDDKEDGIDVNKFAIEFNKKYIDDNNYGNQDLCGGMTRTEVLDMVGQLDQDGKAVVGIRFFFGYDTQVKNKIRILLFAVRENGQNLIIDKDGNEALMMERNWPPN